MFCNYTNNSGETCIPCDEINVKAFQNGVELKVVCLFEKQDDSTVSVEFTDGQKHSFDIKAE